MSFAPLAAASFASFTISEVLYAQSATCRSGVAAAILINPSRIGDAPSSGIVQIELVYLFLRVYAREMPSEENLCTHKTGYAKRASGMLFPIEELPPAGGGSSPYPRRRGKRVDTYCFYTLDSRFPLFLNLAQTRDRRPLRKEERQSGYCCVSFVKYSQFTDSLLLHMRVTLRWVRHKVNCPQGKRRSPGDDSAAQLVCSDITGGTCEFHLSMSFIRTYGGRKRIAK